MKKNTWLVLLILPFLYAACSREEPTPLPSPTTLWVEDEMTFAWESSELFGILTLPAGEGPFPAIVMVSGSGNESTGVRSGTNSRYFTDHARRLAPEGFAVLRYDPPGVGKSTGETGFASLETRASEVMAAVSYLQARPDISSDHVGLHGNSQGAWVNALAAASHPDDVAFIINVSGAGMSVAEQQIHSVEAQSINAGFTPEDVQKAVLFGRLLVDWQLEQPLFKEMNEEAAQQLGDGPWREFLTLVYEAGEMGAAEALQQGIDILKAIQYEPWAEFLYPGLYINLLESVAPEQIEDLRKMTAANLISDPREYFTHVSSPLLAFFGEDDLLQPTERSADLYEEYLTEAGNEHYQIVILPDVGHNIGLTTPGYWDQLVEWLKELD